MTQGVEVEQEDRAVDLPERGQEFVEDALLPAPIGLVEVERIDVDGFPGQPALASPLRSLPTQCDIQRDPVDPRVDRGLLPETVQRPPNLEQDLLDQVPRVRWGRIAPGNRDDATLVALEQFVEQCLPARFGHSFLSLDSSRRRPRTRG